MMGVMPYIILRQFLVVPRPTPSLLEVYIILKSNGNNISKMSKNFDVKTI